MVHPVMGQQHAVVSAAKKLPAPNCLLYQRSIQNIQQSMKEGHWAADVASDFAHLFPWRDSGGL